MDRIDDYCLFNIFQFLGPVDWIKVSQVCCRWENLSARLWKTTLLLKSQYRMDHSSSDIDRENEINSMIMIDYETSLLILQNAASQIRHLRLNVSDFCKAYYGTVIQFGSGKPFLVDDLELHDAVNVLRQYASHINDTNVLIPKSNADLFEMLQIELLIRASTQLKELKVSCDGKILNHVSSRLESLTLQKIDLKQINFYAMEKVCSNLETLNIQVRYASYPEVISLMEKVTSCTPKLKKLFLDMKFETVSKSMPLEFLRSLNSLENIHIVNSGYHYVQLSYRFVCEWASLCPSLKIVKLSRISVSAKSLEVLLLLPKLEVLEISEVPDMPAIVQQSLPYLKELSIRFVESNVNWQNLLDAIEKMPALSQLDATFLPEEVIMQLTEKVIDFFTQLSKIVIIVICSFRDHLKIYDQSLGLIDERNERFYDKMLLITNPCLAAGDRNSYFNKVKKLVRLSSMKCIVEEVSWS